MQKYWGQFFLKRLIAQKEYTARTVQGQFTELFPKQFE